MGFNNFANVSSVDPTNSLNRTLIMGIDDTCMANVSQNNESCSTVVLQCYIRQQAIRLEMCMGMGNTGIPWDSHGNGNKISHGMGMGKKHGKGN